MDLILKINWHDLLVPQTGLLDIVVRGTFIYWFLLVLLRIFRRPAGAVAVPDMLVLVLLADASQNAMAHEYKSLTEGAVLVGTILLWNYFIDWLEFRVPFVRRLLEPGPIPLVKDGKLQRRNMRREFITHEELMTHLRQNGVDDLAQVKRVCLDGSGEVSVVKQNQSDSGGKTSAHKAGVK
jgi:uncharacterized membrane protein YcaP (DUF421 family)